MTFGAGQQTKTVGVTVAKKAKSTVSRSFVLTLQNPSANAVLGDTSATAGLRSTGTATPPPTAAISDVVALRRPLREPHGLHGVALGSVNDIGRGQLRHPGRHGDGRAR